MLSYVDYTHGGIGMTPKFHHAKAFELLITHHYFNPNNKVLKKAIEITLDKMARGGIYDQLLGGFFRYSTDQEWYIPHFEKMLYDNAELLHLYSLAYQVYRKPLYKKVAEGILNYYKTFGSNPQGGFYASQDADIGDLDEGGYYTFSLEEIKKILEPEEFEVLGLYFDLESEKAILPHSQKYVLSVAREEENIAKILNRPINEIQNLIESAKKKLLNYREKTRPNPFIDKTIYTNWNGLMIEALCTYWKVFSDDWSKDMAEKTARYILKKHYDGINLKHTEGVDGFCEDYFFFVKGLLALFEITQNTEFLEIAVILTERAIELFWDEENWGFFDRNEPGEGLLSIRVKNIQDAPVQSSNGVAPYVLLLLANVSEKSKFLDYAEMSLQAFAKLIENMPTLSYSYFLSLYAYLRGIFKVTTSEYFEDALRIFRPFKFVLFSQIEGLVVCEGKVCQKYKTLSELFGKTVY